MTQRSADISSARSDFPLFAGKRISYLDSAATTQKPNVVIDAMAAFYRDQNTQLENRASDAYADARRFVAGFLIAPHADDIVFCEGTTAAINLVAQSWGRANVQAGDDIVVTGLEHHANLAPWFALAQSVNATVRVAPLLPGGAFNIDALRQTLTARTKLVAVTHASNVLGTILPIGDVVDLAHKAGANVLVDGAQSIAHIPVDVADLNVDFYACSAHKAYGPNGIGALYIKPSLMDAVPPWQLGSNAIPNLALDRWTTESGPARFEAGSANVAGAIGMAAGLRYLQDIGFDNVLRHESELYAHARARLSTVRNVRLLGGASARVPILSFVIDGRDSDDIGVALAKRGVQVRAGHMSALPLMRELDVASALRLSLGVYNEASDIDLLVDALGDIDRW